MVMKVVGELGNIEDTFYVLNQPPPSSGNEDEHRDYILIAFSRQKWPVVRVSSSFD